MPQKAFDSRDVRAAMRSYLDVAQQLDEAAAVGGDPRTLLDLAESKAMAGMLLRKALEREGWTGPSRDRSGNPLPAG